MVSQKVAMDEMNAALQRLDAAIVRKLTAMGCDEGNEGAIDSLKAENAKLEEENKQLRKLHQDSVKKLDITIARLNDVLNAS